MKSTKLKTDKGITLIALIITIVVLMILAAVAINSITNEGIISKAESVKDKYEQEQIKEKDMLDYYEELLAGTLKYVKDVQEQVFTENTNVYDEYGNKIVVPAGFMITKDAATVEEGIVIEDCTETATKGSQFVWIPVGKVNSSKGTKTIELNRYTFTYPDGMPTPQDAKAIEPNYYSVFQELATSSYGNATARNLSDFITSANAKGGYYIGRYEARNNNETVTTVATHTVWGNINQLDASSESREMYGDGYGSGTFSSDLINSYAWDTAIVFLQEFDDREGENLTPYSYQTTLTEELSTTGTTTDVVCNIYDMASNCYEWTTEYCKAWEGEWKHGMTMRGGSSQEGCPYGPGARLEQTIHWSGSALNSFRPVLYVAL